VERPKAGKAKVISMFIIYTNEFLFFNKIYQNFLDLIQRLTSSNKDNIYLIKEANMFKEKSMCQIIPFLVKYSLPITENGFYKTLSDNILKNIINNLDNILKGKRNFNDIFQISIVECEKKLDKYYPGVISKIFNNQYVCSSNQINTDSLQSLENDVTLLKNTNLDTKLSQKNNENSNKIKVMGSAISNSLSFNSERDESDKKEVQKVSNLDRFNKDIMKKDHILTQETNNKNKHDEKTLRRKSNTGTNLERVISPVKIEINKKITSGNLQTFKTKLDPEQTKQGLKLNFIKSSFQEDKLESSQKKFLDSKNRKDIYGTPIIKGSKRHKLTFRDQKGMKFIFQEQVESYKKYNHLNKYNEENYSEPSNKMTCCKLI
jgi:hypothetical protein